jgi:voltage-gated potassium channel
MTFLKKMHDLISSWEATMLTCMAYVMFEIPLEAAFQHDPSKIEISMDLFISALFCWDFLSTGTRRHITRYPNAWIAVHFISCLPLLTLAVAFSGKDQSWPIYLQVARFVRAPGIIEAIIERSKSHLVPKRLKFITVAVVTALAINLLACIWLFIYPPGDDPITDYNKAIYFLVTTIATVGYGDIIPTTNGGRVFAMGVMILGATIWGILIASASRMMLASDRRKERKKEKIEALHSMFRHYEVPKPLQAQVLVFFNHLWSRKMSEDEHAIFSELPPALQAELHNYMNLKPISRVSLFKNVSFECLSEASKKLEQVFFSPGEQIIRKGEKGHQMYLIGHGNVTVHIDDQYITTLGEGSCFGEMALIGDSLRSTDVTAASYCDMFILSKAKFDELFNAHPDLRQNIQKMIEERKNNGAVPPTPSANLKTAI